MAEVWGVLGALACVVRPMALAGRLLARPERRRPRLPLEPRGKMPGKDGG